MPAAITPARRSRDNAATDGTDIGSPDMIPSSQPASSNKRLRLNNGSASPSLNGTPFANGYHSQSSLLQREAICSKGAQRKHQPGSIVRVKLANFVTYKAVEFWPGPSLNMVIGPNGTGKSTLVCAICLGLGWGPQHLGRAKEVSEYVKHGSQEGTIEIELAKDGKRFKKNIVIRCTIKREGNKSIYTIDGKPQNKKVVLELARSLSIQIDNLCQFLPQDKVVEFAAMTPVELLRSTQRAVASQEMIDMHEQLKELRKKQREAQARRTADQDSLANLEGRQRLQEADVERIREREQTVKRISNLEAARPFVAYRTARLMSQDAKSRSKRAQRELERLQDEVAPALRAVNAKREYKEQIGAVVSERKDAVSKAERRADGIDRKFRDLHDRHNEYSSEFVAERNGAKKHKDEILKLQRNITGLKRQMEEHPSELDVQNFNLRIREKRTAIQNCRDQIGELHRKQTDLTQLGKEKKILIQQAQHELAKLDSEAGKQNIKLRNLSPDTAKLWAWLQQHQHEFDKPVFGPPLVECSVKDVTYVNHIEALFQRTNMLSFTVQTKDDFKKLSDAGFSLLRLSDVNIKTMEARLDHFRPPIKPDEMKRFGFDYWAFDLLSGPEPVLAMLCAEVSIHALGIGTRDTTPQQFAMLQDSPIMTWVTSRSSYKISRRREYGPGATATNVKAVKPANIWTEQPVDLTAKRELQESIAGWNEEVEGCATEIKEAQTRIVAWRDAHQKAVEEERTLSSEKAAKQKALGEFKALPTRLNANEDKLATAQKAIDDIKYRLRDIIDRQDAIAMQRAQVALDYADAVDVLRVCHNGLHEAEVTLIEANSDYDTLVERNRSVTDLLQDQRRIASELQEELQKIHVEARRLMETCHQLLANEEMRPFFQSLPEGQTTEELETEIDSEKARLELMHEGNGGVIKEYEARQKKIDALASRLQEVNFAVSELDDKIKELRDQWEPELDSLVKKISDSFSFNMEQINCAGEVGVYKDDDFDQWAIHIRVKFRESEPLTTLNSHRQSGGERAVSTIFYLMSLQSLTRSPFRVVDEINQGMDPRNERLVHKRMVGIACGDADIPTINLATSQRNMDEKLDGDEGSGSGGGQYFLITPKLLPNLTYERGMQVLCIASGEYMPVERSRVDFKGCVDLMRGLRAGGIGVAAAG